MNLDALYFTIVLPIFFYHVNWLGAEVDTEYNLQFVLTTYNFVCPC